MTADKSEGKPFRILALDGGGAKGVYTLGVLHQIEALAGKPLHEAFDLVFGTSTGSIIAAMICLRKSVNEIHDLYRQYVPVVMKRLLPSWKSAALHELAQTIFGETKFDAFRTPIGIVCTRWMSERPMIFKTDLAQAHGGQASFDPGFGCTIGEAVEASCSAYPFFKRKIVHTSASEDVELVDGGYCANNPTLFALADAVEALKLARPNIRIVSIGVGEYPKPRRGVFTLSRWIGYLPSVKIAQKLFEVNTQSMDQLRAILFEDIQTVRINEAFTQPEMAADLFEHDLTKLNMLWQRGRQSFAPKEEVLRQFLL